MVSRHAQKAQEVLLDLKVTDKGLSKEEAEERLNRHGLNEIRKEKETSILKLFIGQFLSPLVGVLIIAIIISFFLGEIINGIVIAAIIILNAILGFVQEFRAERAIDSLQKLAAPKSKVIRDGKVVELPSRFLVPGDLILVETGDKIAADARIIEAINLQVEEAALTGESVPSEKYEKILPEKTQVSDQENMLFQGTIVTRGRAKAVVVETGMHTQFGKIAKLIQEVDDKSTPLQKRISSFTHSLAIAAGVVLILTFIIGLLRGQPIIKMILTSISLAVAIVPEGLPIVVTISLALGVQRMIKRNALMRNLPSVETLGNVSVICTDKTGTLTHNEMTVKKLWVGGATIDLSGSGYSKQGIFHLKDKIVDPKRTEFLQLILKAGMLCNNAKFTEENGTRSVIGDPTEASLIVSAEKAGFTQEELTEQYPRTGEIEFTSERKKMTTLHKMKNKTVALTKGAPDVLLKSCNRIYINGQIQKLSKESRQEVAAVTEEFASQALRVLGFAYKERVTEGTRLEDVEKEMIFIGLQAMIDPPRDEAKEAVQRCKTAGIKVVMVTGDHKTTASAIASEIGIEGKVLTGEELDALSAEELRRNIESIGVIARVNPEHKMRIIEAFKTRGHIVAMTGDGINDAPALKKADIGIAMGLSGTDVAKEASGMILTDDNFTSIVNAVEEGRTVFDNIKIFLKYLLTGNSAELICIFLALIIGLPLPLLVLQILWINVVTETIPAIALSKEPPTANIMQRPPRKPQKNLLNKKDVMWIALIATVITFGSLGAFYYALISSGWTYGTVIDPKSPPSYYIYATTLIFTTLVLFQMFNVFNTKSPRRSAFSTMLNNPWLILGTSISILLQVAIVQLPFFNQAFGTTPLSALDWIVCAVIASSVLWVGEITKVLAHHKKIVLDA